MRAALWFVIHHECSLSEGGVVLAQQDKEVMTQTQIVTQFYKWIKYKFSTHILVFCFARLAISCRSKWSSPDPEAARVISTERSSSRGRIQSIFHSIDKQEHGYQSDGTTLSEHMEGRLLTASCHTSPVCCAPNETIPNTLESSTANQGRHGTYRTSYRHHCEIVWC